MPGGDRTGPQGFGPMTGRAAGFCAGYSMPGYANQGGGRGMGMGWRRGMGRGGGRGWRHWFYATGIPGWARAGYGFSGLAAPPLAAEQELDGLKQQAEYLQESLSHVSERIEQLEKEKK